MWDKLIAQDKVGLNLKEVKRRDLLNGEKP